MSDDVELWHYVMTRNALARCIAAAVAVMRQRRGKERDAGDTWLKGRLDGSVLALQTFRIYCKDWRVYPAWTARVDPAALAAEAC